MDSPQKLRRLQPVMLALLSSCAPIASHANAESLISSLRACAAKTDDAERLQCYDKAMAAAPAAATAIPRASAPGSNAVGPNAAASSAAPSSPGVPNAATPGAAASTPASPDSSFGHIRTPIVKKASDAKSKQMTAQVVSVGASSHGLIVTLDNDQVWAQQEEEGPFPLKVGDTVTVKAGLLGAYWMSSSGAGNRTIRVQRTK